MLGGTFQRPQQVPESKEEQAAEETRLAGQPGLGYKNRGEGRKSEALKVKFKREVHQRRKPKSWNEDWLRVSCDWAFSRGT